MAEGPTSDNFLSDRSERWNRFSFIFISYFMGLVRCTDNGADMLSCSACIYRLYMHFKNN